jgi:hypothetical protein
MLSARWAWPLVTVGLLLGTGACSPSPSKVAGRLLVILGDRPSDPASIDILLR